MIKVFKIAALAVAVGLTSCAKDNGSTNYDAGARNASTTHGASIEAIDAGAPDASSDAGGWMGALLQAPHRGLSLWPETTTSMCRVDGPGPGGSKEPSILDEREHLTLN